MDFLSSTYRAKSFIIERDTSSIAYEVKRTRALWDDGLAVPGTNRRGGWRCPPGTRYGGQITDRFGRNCGWGVSRRLANSISDLGERLENIGDRRQVRRENRVVRRQVRRPGMVERAAGRIADALDDTNTPVPAPRGRRERQGPARRRPNLRNSEQRRMDREINEPGADRTAPEGGAPTRPRPDAPRARRRAGAVDVAERKPAKKAAAKKAAAKKAPAKKAAAKKAPAKKAAAKKAPAKKAAAEKAPAKLRPYDASFQRLGWKKDGDKWVKGNWRAHVNSDGALVAQNPKTGEIIEQDKGSEVSTADHLEIFEGFLEGLTPTTKTPAKKPANSANAVQKLPQGWRQGPGTLVIHEDGDIIDEAILTGKWFVIYGRPAVAKDGFDNREDAIAWHKKNVLERKPAKKAGRSKVPAKLRVDSDNAANSERLRRARAEEDQPDWEAFGALPDGPEGIPWDDLDNVLGGLYGENRWANIEVRARNVAGFSKDARATIDRILESRISDAAKALKLQEKLDDAKFNADRYLIRLNDFRQRFENEPDADMRRQIADDIYGANQALMGSNLYALEYEQALERFRKGSPKFGEKINLEKALKDDRFNDYLNDVIKNGRLEVFNDPDNFGQTERSRFRARTRAEAQIALGEAQIDKIQRLINRGSFKENDYIEVGQGIVTLGRLQELLRENVNAWKQVAESNRPKPPNRGDKKPNLQPINIREVFEDSRFFADYEGAAERIDGIADGLGVDNAAELADELDAIGIRLNGMPQDAIVQVPNPAFTGLKEVKVRDLRKNITAAAEAWRRYARRQPNKPNNNGNNNQPNNNGNNNQEGLRRLNQVNLDANDAINAVAQIMQDDIGAQEFLGVGFIDELKLANRIQNRDYIQRIKEIFDQDNAHAVGMLNAGIEDLKRAITQRADNIRRQFSAIESESDDGIKKVLAKAAIEELVRFDAQKDQLREMQNFLADLRNKKVRANAPEPNSGFFEREEFINFVKVSNMEMPNGLRQNIAREFNEADLLIVRDLRRIEQVDDLGAIDDSLERQERRRLVHIEKRNEAIAKVIELRGLLAQNRDDAVVGNRYWESLNALIAANNKVRYDAKVMEAYNKRRQKIVEQLEQLGQEGTSEILRNENAVKEARNRVTSAIKKHQGVLAKYLNIRYGKDNKPWLDMTPEKMKDLKARAIAGEPEAQLELITWAKAMYEHPVINGTNGKKYQIAMDRGVNIRNNGDIFLNGTIYYVDENGRRTAIGSTEREVHISADDPKEWYVKNALLKITSERHKKAGIATTYNQHAYMWANAAGIPQAKVGTAWDGPYVWARAGFRTKLYNSQVKNMEKQLRLFRDGNMGGIIQNEAEAVRIAALIREYQLWERIPPPERPEQPPVGHIDFIYALDIPEGVRGQVALQKARQNQLKEWFVANMGLGSGTFDFKQNGITKDPRE